MAEDSTAGGWYTESMERLVVVVQELSLARSVAAIQDIVRRAACQLTTADGATFVLREGDLCYYADEDAIDPLWKGQRFPMLSCISGWTMLHRQSAVIEDIYADSRIPHEACRPTFVKSLAMVPIRTRDPIGAIGVYWARRYRPRDEELRLIQALADTTAVAMENVAVHAELERRVRERTAEAVAAREEAERANALKTRFLTAANHDLRQPLQSIELYLAALAGAGDAQALREICDKARGSVGAMGELLDALLDLHRLESGAVVPAIEDFALRPLLERIAADNRAQAAAKGLALVVDCQDCVARSDPALLRRMIENLVGNAIRYTQTGSVTLSGSCEGKRVRIAVRDTGIGIGAEAVERIFDAYVQLANPERDRRKGLGLGLSIVRHLAEVLDHRITVESAPCAGSTFSIELPAGTRTAAPAPSPPPAPAAALNRAPVVLLVEDDAAIADATTMLLRISGIQAHHAASADAALDLLRAGLRPDVLVTDYRLPRASGIDVIAGARTAVGRQIPALLYTGDTSLQAATLGIAGCTLLHKPVDTDELIAHIRRLAATAAAGGADAAQAS